MGFCNCSMFCCTLLCVHSSFAIISMGKRELVALLCLSSWCLVIVVWLFLTMPRGCLQFVIVVFPDHTHYSDKKYLTGVTVLWSLSKTHLCLLSTGSTQEDRPCLTERLLMGRKETNQTKQTKSTIFFKSLHDTTRYIQWAFPSLLFQTSRKNPLASKGLKYLQHFHRGTHYQYIPTCVIAVDL